MHLVNRGGVNNRRFNGSYDGGFIAELAREAGECGRGPCGGRRGHRHRPERSVCVSAARGGGGVNGSATRRACYASALVRLPRSPTVYQLASDSHRI